jgi:hypothetical protein
MKYVVILLPLLALLAGCVRSVHPFYTSEQVVFDPTMSGTWADADLKNKFVVTPVADATQYEVAYTDKDNKTGHFIVHLAKLQDQLFADVSPAEPSDENDTYTAHLLPLHSLLLVENTPPNIRIRSIDYDWLKKQLESGGVKLRYEAIDKHDLILTASTAELQAFILANLKTPGAFGDATDLHRVEPATKPSTTQASH